MVPWIHAHIGATGSRRLCCVSTEHQQSAVNTSLSEYWNSEALREIRQKMLAGEKVPACSACDTSMYGSTVLKIYYNTKYASLIGEIPKHTDPSGRFDLEPASFDYRSNQCNFKCRMCGPGSSSLWASEYGEDIKASFTSGHDFVKKSDSEIIESLESGRLREIYWAGGEPLVMKRHWDIMNRIVQSGRASEIEVRYNSNLSNISWRGQEFKDLIREFKFVELNASIDAPSEIGEFLRTGLEWKPWVKNVDRIRSAHLENLQFKLDLTLTLPGLFGLAELLTFASRSDLSVHAKLVGTDRTTSYLSPLALPRDLLNELLAGIQKQIAHLKHWSNRTVFNLLEELAAKPTFEETDFKVHREQLISGYRESQRLAEIRGDGKNGRITIEQIYSRNDNLSKWWNSVSQLSAEAPRDLK